MQKVYTLAGLLVLASTGAAMAQNGGGIAAPAVIGEGTELFLSEYDEGAHMNMTACPGATTPSNGTEKAIEVYNPTTSIVNLDPYSLRRYSNGSTAVVEEERLRRTTDPNTPSTVPNTLAPSTAYVYANGRATLAAILNVIDQLGPPAYQVPGPNTLTRGGIAEFNGNDAVALVRWSGAVAGQGTPMIVDVFGVIGNDPGTQWAATDPVTGTFTASGNQSLKRRANISGGGAAILQNTTTGYDPTSFNITTEWEQYSTAFPNGMQDACAQSYADLGTHTYTGPNGSYIPLGVLEDFNNAISFYPNPATTGRVNVSLGTAKVGQLLLINSVGKSIAARPATGASNLSLDVSSLTPGLYFVRCTSADGKLTVYKELVVQ